MQLRGSKTKTKVVDTASPKRGQDKTRSEATTSTGAQDVQLRRSSRQRKVIDYNLRSLEMASLTSQSAEKSPKMKKAEKRKLNRPGSHAKRFKPHEHENFPSVSTVAIKQRTPTININDLTSNVMVMIFEKLSIPDRLRAERVCRRWRYLSSYSWTKTKYLGYESLYYDPENASKRYEICDNQMGALIQKTGRFLDRIDLGSFRENLTYNVCKYLVNTTKLESIDLTGIRLTNSAMTKIGQYCPRLKSATFTKCFQQSNLERGLSEFLAGVPRLERLYLSDNENLCGGASFSKLPSTLQYLNLHSCYRLESDALSHIGEQCPDLKELSLQRVDMLSVEALNAMFYKLKSLEVLKFGEFYIQTIPNGIDLVSIGTLKNLRHVELCDNILVTDQVLQSISRGCTNLEFLDIECCNRGLSDQGLCSLGDLSKLKLLNLSGIRCVDNNVLRQISRRGVLKQIQIRRCINVSDAGIDLLLGRCKSLTKLDVSYCPNVTNRSVQLIHELLNKRHGKTRPECDKEDRIFHLSVVRSGITATFENRHPWLAILQEPDRNFVDNLFHRRGLFGILRFERIMHVLVHYHDM